MFDIRYKMKYGGAEWPVFRVNLHTHTKLSSGSFSPSLTRNLYNDDHALAITDTAAFPSDLKYDSYMPTIPAIEWKVPGPRDTTVTLLVYGVPSDIKTNPASLDEAFEIAKSVNALVYIAHPHKSGLTPRELLAIGRFDGIEIYNADARKIGKEYSLNTWENVLDGGMPKCGAIATDGFHHPNAFRCAWTMIAAKDNSPDSLLEAMRERRFYCTQGPMISCLEYAHGHIHAEFTNAVEVLVIGNTPHVPEHLNVLPKRLEGFPFSGSNPADSPLDIGPEFEHPINCIDQELCNWSGHGSGYGYVRLQIKDKAGNYAWSQAFEY